MRQRSKYESVPTEHHLPRCAWRIRDEGYFPIMHVLAFKRELSQRYPELPAALFQLFEQARRKALQQWNDPNWSMLLWGRRELEHEKKLCTFDPWRNGLEPNRKNIERFALYSYEQGLSRRQWTAEELFVPIGALRRPSI